MPAQYFTLRALSNEFNPILHNGVIAEVFTQSKNELIILIRLPAVLNHNQKLIGVFISVEPKFNYVVLRDRVTRAKRNSVYLFPDMLGAKIMSVTIHKCNRELICILLPT